MNDDMNQYQEGYIEDDMNPYKDIEWYDFWDDSGKHHTPYFDEMREDDERMHKKWNGNLSIGNVKFVIKYIKKNL